jgi:hypothetical protein
MTREQLLDGTAGTGTVTATGTEPFRSAGAQAASERYQITSAASRPRPDGLYGRKAQEAVYVRSSEADNSTATTLSMPSLSYSTTERPSMASHWSLAHLPFSPHIRWSLRRTIPEDSMVSHLSHQHAKTELRVARSLTHTRMVLRRRCAAAAMPANRYHQPRVPRPLLCVLKSRLPSLCPDVACHIQRLCLVRPQSECMSQGLFPTV